LEWRRLVTVAVGDSIRSKISKPKKMSIKRPARKRRRAAD
jgi:hypothetical protein